MVNELLGKALQCELENKINESEQYYLQALAQYPENKDVLCHVAIARFKRSDYETALDLFVKCYSHPEQNEITKEDILNQILDAYYQPNRERFKNNYEKNIQAIMGYEHNYIKSFTAFEELPFLCIPKSEFVYYVFDTVTKRFKDIISLHETHVPYPDVIANQCVVAVNIFDTVQLQGLAEQTVDQGWINNLKVPIYLICADHTKMQQYLQLADYTSLLDLRRFVLFPDAGK